MLYHVLNYNKNTGIAKVVDASLVGNADISPSSFHVSVYIDESKIPTDPRTREPMLSIKEGMTYSFIPRDQIVEGTFVRGELDYSNPLPKGTSYASIKHS
jgi:hypothetical protein